MAAYVLVGGAGFIGSLLSQRLLDMGHEVICLDYGGVRERCRQQYAEALASGRYAFWDASADEADLLRLLARVEGLVLLAAKRLDKHFTSQTAVENLALGERYFRLCQTAGLKNLVFLSSIGVFGKRAGQPWPEEAAGEVENLYALSKWQTELLADYYNDKGGMAIKSLRPAQVLGLGERPGYVLNTFINQAHQKQSLCLYGTGQGRRQYIYIDDLVGAIVLALGKPDCRGSYNIACEGSLSIRELAQEINRVFENPSPLLQKDYPAEDLGHYEMAVDKAQTELGFRAWHSVSEALRDIRQRLEEA